MMMTVDPEEAAEANGLTILLGQSCLAEGRHSSMVLQTQNHVLLHP